MSTKRGAETLTDYKYRNITIRHFNPLNAELNPMCHLLALLGAHRFFHVSGLRVNINPDAKRFLSLRSRLKNEYKDMVDE